MDKQPYNLKHLSACLFLLFLASGCLSNGNQSEKDHNTSSTQQTKARQLILEMISAAGGVEALKNLKDVSYQYTYTSFDGFADISTERYIFDGEYSWAQYTEHNNAVMTNTEGIITQGYDGIEGWVAVDGVTSKDRAAIQMSTFFRKTNFYWFCMNFKLLDPGVIHLYEGTREVNDINYEMVRISFEKQAGSTTDEFLLYLNPETKLIDQFLFTVKALGINTPLMMKLRYEEFSGAKLTTYRAYAPANWQGELTSDEGWTTQISDNIQFNNGFKPSVFRRPD